MDHVSGLHCILTDSELTPFTKKKIVNGVSSPIDVNSCCPETDLGRPAYDLVDAAVRERRDDGTGVGRRGDDPVGRQAARQLAHQEHHGQLQIQYVRCIGDFFQYLVRASRRHCVF